MREIVELNAKVDGTNAKDRLDKVLSKLFPFISRRKSRVLIDKGSVYLNGKRCLISSKIVNQGDKLKVVLDKEDEPKKIEEISILYEDENFIALNKPPFLPSIPTKTDIKSALHFVSRMKKIGLKDIHIVNRLDTPVSGVVLFALSIDSAHFIENLKEKNKIEKIYLAIVKGEIEKKEGSVEIPLKFTEGYAFPSEAGKKSVTRYEVLKSSKGFSLLKVIPLTGRMHQIRVHLKEIGFPIVGDRKYGEKPFLAQMPLLHCFKISFIDKNGRKIEIEGKPFNEFEKFQKELL